MDNCYMISTNPLCSVKGGVAFWIAKLTPEQIEAEIASFIALEIMILIMDQLLDFKPLVTPLSALEPQGDMNPAKDDTEYIWTLEICSTLFSRPSRSG